MTISEIILLLSECKTDIEEGVCGGCRDFSHDHPCPNSCEYMQKMKALEMATDLLSTVASLQIPAKERTDER